LGQKPCNDSVGDCCAINVASLQLSQKLRSIPSARLDEALAPVAILVVFARLEKPMDCRIMINQTQKRLTDYALLEIHPVMKLEVQ